jgi:hypothetical protein
MEQNKKDQFAQPQRKTETPDRKSDISGGSRTKPEIDLPVKGGRSESDLSSQNSPRREDDKSSVRPDRSSERSSR